MKLLVVGSRSIENFDLSPYIDTNVSAIISGGACGIDTIAETPFLRGFLIENTVVNLNTLQ